MFFFLMIPPPPTSTLFPYTTLFRSFISVAIGTHVRCLAITISESGDRRPHILYSNRQKQTLIVMARQRSEEHTSELQSHSDLVCRLLLEKKKISHMH